MIDAIASAKSLGAAVSIDGSTDDAFLVLDTRRFGQFSVESLRYDVAINAMMRGGSHANMVTDLKMQIIDESGISFAKFLQWVMDDKLKTNFDGLIFVLKTMFVGHQFDGSTEMVHAETIPMTLSRMDVNLDFSKGTYELEFIPNINFDIRKHSRFLNISTATTAWTQPGGKLGSVIQTFEDNLNKISKKFYLDVQREANTAINGSDYETNGKTPIKYGRLVQYMITIPESWKDFEFSGSNIGSAPEQKIEKAPAKSQIPTENGKPTLSGSVQTVDAAQPGSTSAYASAARGVPITSAIDGIFKQVLKIAEMANTTKKPGADDVITFYKHIVGITSSDDSMVIHVDVVEFKVPNIQALNAIANDKAAVSTNQEQYMNRQEIGSGQDKISPKDFLEWDYIFTSKNDSILNFDIKMQDFNALFQSNLRGGDGALREGADNAKAPKPSNETELLFMREYDPVLMPENTAAALKNFKDNSMLLKNRAEQGLTIGKIQKYHQNLSAFYASNVLDVMMTIRGNPELLRKFNFGTVLEHAEITDKTEYRKNLEERILKTEGNRGNIEKSGSSFTLTSLSEKSYTTSPVFAKVNIRGPNVDFSTGAMIDGDYSATLFEDNYYVIFKVSHIFNRSVFTQEVELRNFNIYSPTKKKQEIKS